MAWTSIFPLVIYLVGIALALFIARYAWQRRSIPGAEFLALYMLSATLWSIGVLIDILLGSR